MTLLPTRSRWVLYWSRTSYTVDPGRGGSLSVCVCESAPPRCKAGAVVVGKGKGTSDDGLKASWGTSGTGRVVRASCEAAWCGGHAAGPPDSTGPPGSAGTRLSKRAPGEDRGSSSSGGAAWGKSTGGAGAAGASSASRSSAPASAEDWEADSEVVGGAGAGEGRCGGVSTGTDAGC